jgi:hypothetical protein
MTDIGKKNEASSGTTADETKRLEMSIEQEGVTRRMAFVQRYRGTRDKI